MATISVAESCKEQYQGVLDGYAMATKLTTKEFVARCRKVHGRSYGYLSVKYVGMDVKVSIRCRVHGIFKQTPLNHLHGKQGCPKCWAVRRKGTVKRTVGQLKSRLVAKFGRKYQYHLLVYDRPGQRIILVCREHGEFSKSVGSMLAGKGCPKCFPRQGGGSNRLTQDEFLKRARKIHGRKYDYSHSRYTLFNRKLTVICKKHGAFETTPESHIFQKRECPACRDHSHSKISLRWIEFEAKRRRMKGVQHAAHRGEYRIPGTRLKVDGYHHRTKTVFEFYGDAFHGNPLVYKARDRCNPFSSDTATQLYRRTLAREEKLRKLGYRVISIWESDFREIERSA